MDKELLLLIGIVALIVVFFIAKGIYTNRLAQKNFRYTLQDSYGSLPKKEYNEKQYRSIQTYFRKTPTDNSIDDITWNDLEMDLEFVRMNHTYSSAGEEYLYYRLRNPKKSIEELNHDEEVIRYYTENEEERINTLLAFRKLGKTGNYSIFDYLDYLKNVTGRSNLPHIMSLLWYVASIGLVFVNPFLGIVAFLVVLIYNMATYAKIKGEIEPYYTSILYVSRIVNAVDAMKSTPPECISENMARLKKHRKLFAPMMRKIGWLSTSQQDGNLSNIMFIYLNMMFHIDLMIFNGIVGNIDKHKNEIHEMLEDLGYIESSIAIAYYRASYENWCVPEFTQEKHFDAEELYHPYLDEPVANSLHCKRGVLLTGSNASGKSTFLKTVALNAILAQTIHTVHAKEYSSCLFRIMSSMSLRDDMESGDSYYIVEIKSLKRILDAVREDGLPVLCFVDEVLRGTNTVERIAASEKICEYLESRNSMCFAATHDIELTHLLEEHFDNYHFSEEVIGNDVVFSYKLNAGRATTRNAIRLLKIIGFDDSIVESAEALAGHFVKEGSWT